LVHEPSEVVSVSAWWAVPEMTGHAALVGAAGGGVVVVVAVTYAEIAHVGQLPPLLHDAGSELRVDCAEVTLVQGPAFVSRNATVPPTPSTVIQYVLPATTGAESSAIEFQALATGEDVEPLAMRAPG
jgi:hypothetical protein